jgi:hypothetical protein
MDTINGTLSDEEMDFMDEAAARAHQSELEWQEQDERSAEFAFMELMNLALKRPLTDNEVNWLCKHVSIRP